MLTGVDVLGVHQPCLTIYDTHRSPGIDYEITLYGIDKNGKQVNGTSETFAVRLAS